MGRLVLWVALRPLRCRPDTRPNRSGPAPRRRRRDRPQGRVKENEPFDVAIRRFKRACEKAGVLAEVHRREYYEKPTQVRKRKAAAAVKRWQKKLARQQARRKRLY